MSVALAEVESRRLELEKQAQEIQSEIDARSTALSGANVEYERIQALLAAARSGAAVSSTDAEAAVGVVTAPGGEAAVPSAPPAGAGASASNGPLVSSLVTSAAAAKHTPVPSHAHAMPQGVPHGAAGGSGAVPATLARLPSAATMATAASMTNDEIAAIERRARQLEEEKLRLEQVSVPPALFFPGRFYVALVFSWNNLPGHSFVDVPRSIFSLCHRRSAPWSAACGT